MRLTGRNFCSSREGSASELPTDPMRLISKLKFLVVLMLVSRQILSIFKICSLVKTYDVNIICVLQLDYPFRENNASAIQISDGYHFFQHLKKDSTRVNYPVKNLFCFRTARKGLSRFWCS